MQENQAYGQVLQSEPPAGHRRGCDPIVRRDEKIHDEEPHADYPGSDCRDPKEG